MHRGETTQPRSQIQHGRIDDDGKQPQGQDGHWKRQQPHQWPDEGIHNAKDHADEEIPQDDAHGTRALSKPSVGGSCFGGARGDIHAIEQPRGNPKCKPINQDTNND